MDARIAVDGHPPATALHKSAFGEDTAKASDATALSEKDVLEQKDSVERIDGGLRAWLSVVVSFIQFFVVLGNVYTFGVYQAEYQLREYPESSETAISFIGSTNLALTLFLGIFVGRPCEQYGLRIVMSIGSVIYVASLVGASFCQSVSALIGTQGVLQGIGGACLFVPATAVPAPYWDKKRSLAMGIASSGAGIGGIAWSFAVRGITARLDYRWALRISAIVSAILLVSSIMLTRTPKASASLAKKGSWKESVQFFKKGWVPILYLSSLITVFGYASPVYYLPSYIQTEGGAPPSSGPIISAAGNAGLTIGRIGLGYLSDTRLGVGNVITISMLLGGILQLILWLPAGGSIGASYTFSVLYGIFGAGYIGLYPVYLARYLDHNKLASITGLFFTSELPGQLAGPPISGAILDATGGDYRAVIAYSGGIMTFGALFAVWARFMIEPKIFKTV